MLLLAPSQHLLLPRLLCEKCTLGVTKKICKFGKLHKICFAELGTFFGPSRMASVKIIVIEIKIEKWQLSSHISAHLYMYVLFSIIFQYEVYIYA